MMQARVSKYLKVYIIQHCIEEDVHVFSAIDKKGDVVFQWAATEGKSLEEIKVCGLD